MFPLKNLYNKSTIVAVSPYCKNETWHEWMRLEMLPGTEAEIAELGKKQQKAIAKRSLLF